MKKQFYLFVFAFSFFVVNDMQAQCLPDGITFTSQAQIDSFPINYPGCTVIEGNVIIQEDIGGDIVSLDSLYPLTTIEGSLAIGVFQSGYPPFEPPTLFGIQSLTNLSGLEGLTFVGGSVGLYGNNGLTNLTGLESLTSIGGGMIILENNALTNLGGLENLISIEGGLVIGATYNGPPIDSYFGNASLTSLSGLENLTSIEGGMLIMNNSSLASLSGLENVTSIGWGLIVEGNDSLTSLSGLDNVTSIDGNFSVIDNDSLTNLGDLGNLTSISGYLWVNDNNALTSFSGLENMTSIESLIVSDNDALTSLSGLDNVTIEGNLIVEGNNSLTSLNSLENMTSIGGNLSVNDNDALTSLSGLDNVTTIDHFLSVEGNEALISLSGLENVTSIDGSLFVNDNDALTSLSGLENLDYTTIEVYFQIRFNSNLSICEIQPVCDYLANTTNAIIQDNAPGCNSQQEVEDACLTVSVDDLISEEDIQLYPNPTTGIIQINLPPNSWQLSVCDATGQIVVPPYLLQNPEVDLSQLSPGLYFLEFRNTQQRVVRKVVVE